MDGAPPREHDEDRRKEGDDRTTAARILRRRPPPPPPQPPRTTTAAAFVDADVLLLPGDVVGVVDPTAGSSFDFDRRRRPPPPPPPPPAVAVVARSARAEVPAGPSGITLQAIGLTLGGGLCVSLVSVVAFGMAVMGRNRYIAPRCATRHPNTVWRSRRDMYGESSSSSSYSSSSSGGGENDGGAAGDDGGGGAAVAPGGGAGGRPPPSPPCLRGNAVETAIIGNDEGDNDDDGNGSPPRGKKDARCHHGGGGGGCDDPTSNSNSKSDYAVHPQDRGNPFLGWIPWTLRLSYDRMLRGIPGTGTRDGGMGGKLLGVNLDAIVLFRYHALCLRVTAVASVICICIILPLNISACKGHPHCDVKLTDYGRTTIANIVNNMNLVETGTVPDSILQKFNIFSTIFWTEESLPHLMRLYIISMCSWYIAYFTLKNIRREWRENLVLRRVYYLEADHYGNRQAELDMTVNRQNETTADDGGEEGCGSRGVDDGMGKIRDPWMPHPEHRDTVPNIELYSVLVGGLPSLPDEVVNTDDAKAALGFSNQATIDWQLAVATTFFDHCVPNQPGFSSSVVAVTILPGAPELAKAWRKWYCAAATLRRLRFIRQVIKDKRHYAIDDVDEEGSAKGSRREIHADASPTSPSSPRMVAFLDDEATPRSTHYRESYGTTENTADVDIAIFKSLNYGPEQQAVYSREMAQGAAACCPNGCGEERVRRLPIDRLLEMEDETIAKLEKAQYELQCAQMQAAVSIVDGVDWDDKSEWRKSPREDEAVIDNALGMHRHHPEIPRLNEQVEAESVPPTLYGPMNGRGPTVPRNAVSLTNSARGAKLNGDARSFRGMASPLFIVNECGGHDAISDDGEAEVENTSIHRSNEKIRKLTASMRSPGPSTLLRMNSEGRFFFNNAIPEEDEETSRSLLPGGTSLRRRANTAQSAVSEGFMSQSSHQWEQVNSILKTSDVGDQKNEDSGKREIESGVWKKPSFKSFINSLKSEILSSLSAAVKWTKGKTDPLTAKVAKDSTYCVVTFSSRQAAVAARHCLADGRGVQRWLSEETVPVPPLADAAPCDIITCRGCCRPVTLNINENQLALRRYIAITSLGFIYVFYTIPITAAQSLVSPKNLNETLPALEEWLNQSQWLSAEIMSGLVTALLYTAFFALCPVMFKAIANSGSHATSVQEAEKYALKYYWYFMLVTAFVFTGLADAAMKIWESSFDDVDDSLEALVKKIAAQTPLTTAATWLNWIIVRTTMTLPLQYLLQVNTFLFGCLGWKCCARCVTGGGPGGPIPYRIYVDGGVVFMCVVSLAPQSPLVAPIALLYYFVCVPLWRRNCIFLYRPKFDTGGERWPFLSDMLITSLFMGQFLLTMQMVLANAYGPALFAAIPVLPTYLYRTFLISSFRKAYDDAGLLQTSLLDGWDNAIPTSVEKREEFRQFLVDAHKAAYIPVCIAGGATNILTAEPAVVMPSENDDLLGYADMENSGDCGLGADEPSSPYLADQSLKDQSSYSGDATAHSPATFSNQPGACMRRTVTLRDSSPALSDRGSESPVFRGSESPVSKMWLRVQDQMASASSDPVDPGCNQS